MSSEVDDSERGMRSALPGGRAPSGRFHGDVPTLPSGKLPSSSPNEDNDGRTPVSSVFLRTRLPPRLLPPRTQSRLSRLHRRHGTVPFWSRRHRLFLFRQCRHAWWALLTLGDSWVSAGSWVVVVAWGGCVAGASTTTGAGTASGSVFGVADDSITPDHGVQMSLACCRGFVGFCRHSGNAKCARRPRRPSTASPSDRPATGRQCRP